MSVSNMTLSLIHIQSATASPQLTPHYPRYTNLSQKSSWIPNGKDATMLWFTENGLYTIGSTIGCQEGDTRGRVTEYKGWESKVCLGGSNWVYVNVCAWLKEGQSVCVCIREGEMEDIIRSYWKMKEKVISHVAHLPICLKGLSAHMINTFYKHIYKNIFPRLSDTQTQCISFVLNSNYIYGKYRTGGLTDWGHEAKMWWQSWCLAHKPSWP